MPPPQEPLDIDRLIAVVSSLRSQQRKAGRGAAVLQCHRTVLALKGLDHILKGGSPADDPGSAQKGSWWDWFKRLLGLCTDVDATGATNLGGGVIVEANGDVLECTSGVHCDSDNNLWLCGG